LANSFSASGTARSRKIAANRAVFARGVAGSTDSDVHEVRLSLFLQTFFLYDFSQVEVSLQMSFFLGALVDSLLILAFPGLSFSHLESIVVIELSHFVGILEEIFLEVPQLFLNDCLSLVLVHFTDSSSKAFVTSSVAGFRNCARH
jgi:hypothetical protein